VSKVFFDVAVSLDGYFVLMAIGSDLRARAEETLLQLAFGDSYQAYCARTARFIPGVY
jgi:protein-S-isoprenylcysteine O-methyltransferase Ste14